MSSEKEKLYRAQNKAMATLYTDDNDCCTVCGANRSGKYTREHCGHCEVCGEEHCSKESCTTIQANYMWDLMHPMEEN